MKKKIKNKCPFYSWRNNGCSHRAIESPECWLKDYKKCQMYKEWEKQTKVHDDTLELESDLLELEGER